MVAKKKKKGAVAAAVVDNELIAETRAQMPAELLALTDKAMEYTKTDQQLVLDRWQLGKLVAEATNNERKYGESALRQMAIVLYGSPEYEHLLSRCRVFFNTYKLPHVAALLKQQGSSQRLSWSHFDGLCQLVGTAKITAKREKLELRILDENLGVRATRTEIARIMGGKKNSGAREAARPRNPVAGLQQLAHACQQLTSRNEIYLDDVFTPLGEIEDDAVTSNLVEQLNTAYTYVGELKERLDVYYEQLNGLIEKTSAIAAASGDDADVEEDAEAEEMEDAEDEEETAEELEVDDEETEAPQKVKKSKKSKKAKKRKAAAV